MSRLYHIRQLVERARWLCLGIIGVIVLDLALLIIALVKRREKREFDRTLAGVSGKLWFEVKAIIRF